MKTICIVPTYNGKADLERLLQSLSVQDAEFTLLIVDSSSRDGTAELGKARADIFIGIPKEQFNHGGTRQMAVESVEGYDVAVFLTQDAYLATPDAISNILANFRNPKVGAVCGRQLPHVDANAFGEHARLFNYPEQSRSVDLPSSGTYGIKAAFISNSFSAYRISALKEVGGFPSNVILCEDMFVAARMLQKGWLVNYDASSQCHHSHNYTVGEEFRRYFDLGVFHAQNPWIREQFGNAGGEGMKFVKSELKFVADREPLALLPCIVRNGAKFIGYRLGLMESSLSLDWKKKLSMHKGYWAS